MSRIGIERELADLRHAGIKRWYAWMEKEEGAADAAEAWRVRVCALLCSTLGQAVESEFNEPRSTDHLPGDTLRPIDQHGRRCDRLGDILVRVFGGGGAFHG